MNRRIQFHLNKVTPTPATLRVNPAADIPGSELDVNLGQLFLQYYFDSYPAGPPNPDPSSFEYLQLVSSDEDFRFHAFVAEASLIKRRAMSAEIGQAFCRLMLHDHFGVSYFAHMNDVIGKSTHPAFEGMCIERVTKGDIPDYLCARKVTEPLIAEAKGRFSSIGFDTTAFDEWRQQFTRIRVLDRDKKLRSAKGYIVATRFVTGANSSKTVAATYIEDPATEGEPLSAEQQSALGRSILAMHYSRIFTKLDLTLFASALTLGFALTRELTFQIPVWICATPPFLGKKYIGGYYQTAPGLIPTLSERGWQFPSQLGGGHAVFVGVDASIASNVAAAARGDWHALDNIVSPLPEGAWSSEFAWLSDGTVAAPLTYFLPAGVIAL
jgi:hypothetical protein